MKTVPFDPKELERFDFALSDVLCWMSGFKAAGGDYSPGTEGALRDLRDALRRGDVRSELERQERLDQDHSATCFGAHIARIDSTVAGLTDRLQTWHREASAELAEHQERLSQHQVRLDVQAETVSRRCDELTRLFQDLAARVEALGQRGAA